MIIPNIWENKMFQTTNQKGSSAKNPFFLSDIMDDHPLKKLGRIPRLLINSSFEP